MDGYANEAKVRQFTEVNQLFYDLFPPTEALAKLGLIDNSSITKDINTQQSHNSLCQHLFVI